MLAWGTLNWIFVGIAIALIIFAWFMKRRS